MSKRIIRLIIIFLALSVTTSFSQTKDFSKFFTGNDYFNFEHISDPQISPDGRKIIYIRNFMDVITDKAYSNLWIVNFDGTGNRQLTSGLYHDSSPRWSPDGNQIIYISDREGRPQVYKRWMDTGQTIVLTNLLFPPWGISWSPDEKWIAYSVFVPSLPRTIAQLPPTPPGAKWAPFAIIVDKAIYRFEGIGYLISQGYMHLFVIPSEGGTPRQISQGNFHHPFPIFGGGAPIEWTPDSKCIIISANRKEDWEYDLLDTEIYEFSIADGTMHSLTSRKGPDNNPAVCPNGNLIAYVGFDDRYQGYQVTELYVMNRDGSNPRSITKTLDRSVYNIAWGSDDKGIYFMYDDKGNTKLAYVSLDGKIKTLNGDVGDGRIAYGGGGSYTISLSGNYAFTYTRPNHPSDIAVSNVSNPKPRIITAVNEDILAHKKLCEVEEIWYESSKDRRRIQGWIIKPPDFDPSQKYPLILEIHGGPSANYGDRFSLPTQLLASAGYIVLCTNPRGSTSYGEEFGNLIHNAYPGDEFYDFNSGVDAVIKKGYIDEDNIFVTGGSGGGTLTCWMIGRSDRFRAAASLYPMINWYSWVLTADVAPTRIKYLFPGFPWDNVEHYEKRSLLSVVKNVKTPTIIITGEKDYRTPMSESEQYYMALKLMGVEAVLVRFPEEGHGIFVRPSQHLSTILHIIGWFDQHRKKQATK
jgi:dipeptidyl aminopeptidase/acylaminoacyl peptidase